KPLSSRSTPPGVLAPGSEGFEASTKLMPLFLSRRTSNLAPFTETDPTSVWRACVSALTPDTVHSGSDMISGPVSDSSSLNERRSAEVLVTQATQLLELISKW